MSARDLAQLAYNRVLRHRLPRSYGLYAGVVARDRRLLDLDVRVDDYKPGLLDAIDETVQAGDTVTLVGFGRGVSTVYTLAAGADRVIAYEAAQEMIDIGRETLSINTDEPEAVDIRHALVGPPIEVYGAFEETPRIDPADIEIGDVLICDCEGAEAAIIDRFVDAFGPNVADSPGWPDRMLIEAHPERGVPEKLWTDALDDAGYSRTTRPYNRNGERPDKRVHVLRRDP